MMLLMQGTKYIAAAEKLQQALIRGELDPLGTGGTGGAEGGDDAGAGGEDAGECRVQDTSDYMVVSRHLSPW
jgi:hypothetical protein